MKLLHSADLLVGIEQQFVYKSIRWLCASWTRSLEQVAIGLQWATYHPLKIWFQVAPSRHRWKGLQHFSDSIALVYQPVRSCEVTDVRKHWERPHFLTASDYFRERFWSLVPNVELLLNIISNLLNISHYIINLSVSIQDVHSINLSPVGSGL